MNIVTMGDREEREADQPDNEVVRDLYFDDVEALDLNADPHIGGGTNRAMWWMGRPNLITKHLIWPKLAHTRRPTDFRSTAIVEEACKKRLKEHMKLLDDTKNKILLIS